VIRLLQLVFSVIPNLSGLAVQKFGWIDNANRSIRAHIDYAP
jgi:hypothetical protein